MLVTVELRECQYRYFWKEHMRRCTYASVYLYRVYLKFLNNLTRDFVTSRQVKFYLIIRPDVSGI